MNIQKILVPVDFSPGSFSALERAAELAQTLGAAIDVLYVQRPGEDAVLPRLDAMLAWLSRRGFTPGARIEGGDPATVITRVAADDAYHLIVMGTHGDGRSRARLGHVASKVVETSTVPVLTIRIASPVLEATA